MTWIVVWACTELVCRDVVLTGPMLPTECMITSQRVAAGWLSVHPGHYIARIKCLPEKRVRYILETKET